MVQVSGRWRKVIDLSSCNNYVPLTPFKVEMVSSVLGSIRKGGVMSSVALGDTFLIPVYPDS